MCKESGKKNCETFFILYDGNELFHSFIRSQRMASSDESLTPPYFETHSNPLTLTNTLLHGVSSLSSSSTAFCHTTVYDEQA